MHPVIAKTFGGLPTFYYIRQFPFGLITPALIISLPIQIGFWLYIVFIVNIFLYPYSRFAYERILGFMRAGRIKRIESWSGDYAGIAGYVIGGNTIYVSAGVMLLVKLIIIAVFWSGAVFIAPISLIYLYIHHSRAPAPPQ